jgi:hypothetical protein
VIRVARTLGLGLLQQIWVLDFGKNNIYIYKVSKQGRLAMPGRVGNRQEKLD